MKFKRGIQGKYSKRQDWKLRFRLNLMKYRKPTKKTNGVKIFVIAFATRQAIYYVGLQNRKGAVGEKNYKSTILFFY